MAFIKATIYADMVREKFDGKVKVLNLATDLGKLENVGRGDTISFPKWSLIGDATEMVKGTALTVEELQSTEQTVTVKQVGKATRIYDSENQTSVGNQIEESINQTSIVMARKIDADLIENLKNAPFQSPVLDGTKITSEEIETALLNFGDERDIDEFAGIVVNSLLIPSFYAMTEFTDANNTTVTAGSGLIRNGLLGFYRGIPVFISDKGTYDDVAKSCITFVVKIGALGYMFAKDLDIELEREAKLKATDVVADAIYATALVKEDGVVVLKCYEANYSALQKSN